MQSDTIHEALSTYRQLQAENRSTEINDTELQRIVVGLHVAERRLHRYAEYACNGELTQRQQRDERGIKERVNNWADQMGLKVKFNDDPRGGAIRFILPSKASNNWDNETWGIYY